MKLFILFCMIFCHILADYNLQGWLASAKTKEWWEENCPDELYKHDYLVALFMHSFSWTFMIMLPPTIFVFYNDCFSYLWYICFFVYNVILHMYADNAKANKKVINLFNDQLVHIIQIFATWLFIV